MSPRFPQHSQALLQLRLPLVVAMLLTAGATAASAQDVFLPPQQRPLEQYEATWGRNPFTQKTAPVVEEKKSFAKDFVVHNIADLGNGDSLVVLANTKTKELFRLKKSEPASNGMVIRDVKIKDLRKDSYVEVVLNGESAILRHDDTFRKQMTAGNTARGAAGRGRGADGAPSPDAANPAANGGAAETPASGSGDRTRQSGKDKASTLPLANRPPLPQKPGAEDPQLAQATTSGASMRPGPGPGRGLPLPARTPSTFTRRLLSGPHSAQAAPPPAAAPAPAPAPEMAP